MYTWRSGALINVRTKYERVLTIMRCIMCSRVSSIRAEVEDLARKLGIKLYRTCVKDNVLIEEGVYVCVFSFNQP